VEKPFATNALEARELLEAARSSGRVHAVTFNYRFNPLVEQAGAMLARGELGPVNLVHGHYLQEWLLYDTDYSWRLDPKKSGATAMVADAGCHWFDLIEYTTALKVESVLAELSTMIKVRRPRFGVQETLTSGTTEASPASTKTQNIAVTVPDFGAILLRFDNGARGVFMTSSLCAGHRNDLRFEIHGAVASIRWLQERPNELWVGRRDGVNQVVLKDPSLLDTTARRYAALPGGYNEAWADAFKNLMHEIFTSIAPGSEPRAERQNFPTFEDGYRAACISEAIVASNAAGGRWTHVNS
jgi:predicted dehydrogenase